MRKPRIKNKYNLDISDIKHLQIVNKKELVFSPFERNEYTQCWEISKCTAKNDGELQNGKYNQFTLSIYDSSPDEVKLDVISEGWTHLYIFEEFFNPKDIVTEMDLEIQEILLSMLNDLLDTNILGFPKCLGYSCKFCKSHDFFSNAVMCSITGTIVNSYSDCVLREHIKRSKKSIGENEIRFTDIKSRQEN